MYRKFFAIGLILSFLITGGFLGWQQIQLNMQKGSAAAEAGFSEEELFADPVDAAEDVSADEEIKADLSEPDAAPGEPEPAETDPIVTTAAAIENTPSETDEPDTAEAAEDSTTDKTSTPEFIGVDTSYFEDALFIGDSRMVGIKEYGGLSEPTYFAGTGLSTFRLYKDELEVKGLGTVGFEEVLTSSSFGKVYIMLGINEAGSKLSEFKAQYSRILADIKEKQPDALLFLCANLHVTKAKSEHDSTYANSHIDEINDVIKSLAMRNDAYYLDVNPLFDDGEGNLSTDYAADYAHMYGRCYLTWIDWLCTKGIEEKKSAGEQAY